MSKYTFKQFQEEFPNDEACLAKLMEIRFGGSEITCPGCHKHTTFHPMHTRKAYACQDCGHHVYPCAGSIFHKSSTRLSHWFFAMYLMTSTRHGVAAKEVQRQIGVTYKTAWRICHELRKLMANGDHEGPLGGHVEIDETLVGGRQKRVHHKSAESNKTIVMGMVSREGKIIAGPIPADTREVLEPILRRHVEPGTRSAPICTRLMQTLALMANTTITR
jgi:transposase